MTINKVMPKSTLIAEMKENPFMTTGEVAQLFGVEQSTVVRWVGAGKFGKAPGVIMTLGKRILIRTSVARAAYEMGIDTHE